MFLDETHDMSEGHTCIPNGVGDFDLMCGDKKLGFVPALCYFSIKGKCPKCGEQISYKDRT